MSDGSVPYLSLRDLYMRLGVLSAMEPATEEVMRNRAQRSYVDDEFDSPHKLAWNVSFHASSYPGEPSTACARALVYRMMNVPSAEGPMDPWITSTGTVGKAGEMDVVDAWFKDGRMLAIPEDHESKQSRLEMVAQALHRGDVNLAQDLAQRSDIHQLGFVDREHWLTGSTDLPILPRGWRKPHIIELKAKSDDVIVEMLQGQIIERDGVRVLEPRGPGVGHVNQLRCTVGLAHEYDWGSVDLCASCWRILYADVFSRLRSDEQRLNPAISDYQAAQENLRWCPWCDAEQMEHASFSLDRPTSGELYYWSRSWPRGHPRHGKRTKTFFYDHDPAWMDRGRKVLAQARDGFLAGRLPERPKHMQWSALPCKQCRYRPVCRLDEGVQPGKRKATAEHVQELAESNAVDLALSVRPNYSYEATRAVVLKQWNVEREETP